MRLYLVFFAIGLPIFLGNVGSTAVAVAFPAMVEYFETSLVLTGWVLSIYQLSFIGSLAVTARLSDSVGRKSTYILCLTFFTVGSILCAIAPNLGWLILFRVIQAVGAGGFTSGAVGIFTDEFPAKKLQLIGLISSIANIGAITGPNIGAFMVEYLGWQSIFWVNVPLGIIGVVLCVCLIKADVKKPLRNRMDFLGAGLLTGFVSTVMVSFTLMEHTYSVPLFLRFMILLVGFVFLALFVRRSKTQPGAVVSLELLKRRPFMAANLYNLAYGACNQSGIMALMPLYAISIYGMSTLESGLMMMPRSVGVVVASIVASFSLVKWGYRRPIVIGTIVVSVALIVLALEPSSLEFAGFTVTPAILVMFFALIVGLGAGIAAPAANNACIELQPNQAASITGLRQMSRQMGGAISISVSTLILESSNDLAWGFTVVFGGFGFLLLLSVIAAFFMPKDANSGNSTAKQA